MRSTNDPIEGLKTKLLEWEISEDDLKTIDKEARIFVDKEVQEAEDSAVPENTREKLFEDIYVCNVQLPTRFIHHN